ncbi:hypothetical protein JMI89_08390 [Frischella sp. Ac48]|uniref:Lipoprotein n=1 Tax=Frischella japonica TaxID=2741544 RepID=A0ABR7QX40_9GAMM|nr:MULTISPECIES: hypothetical protein [Frischella]MBC9130765.1 hypothetical protein [Frischella japonica]MBX4133647.1 hypothetical protein [Frischella sp. Ac48]
MRKIMLPLIFITLSLSGCGMIDGSIRSDESIKQKTAFALGTTPDKITISNKTKEMDSVKFNATFKKKVYQCYYTTALVTSSDVLCSPMGKNGSLPKTAQCNALTKAAGQCN